MSKKRRDYIKNMRVLIIDEISMVSTPLFELIHRIMTIIKENDEFFGGVQVLMLGDFLQLSPIYKEETVTKPLIGPRFCFQTILWIDNFNKSNTVYLDKSFRQTDPFFIEFQGRLRMGRLCKEDRDKIRSRYCSRTKDADIVTKSGQTIKAVHLCPTNRAANVINIDNYNRVRSLTDIENKYVAKDSAYHVLKTREKDRFGNYITVKKNIEFQDKYLSRLNQYSGMQQEIKLCKGVQVLNTRNVYDGNEIDEDGFKRLVVSNGSSGVIIDFDEEDNPIIEFANEVVMPITKISHTIKIEDNITLERFTIPIIYGTAITIHKSQGKTLDRAILSLRGLPCKGQAYVAISRVRKLEDFFVTDFDPNCIGMRAYKEAVEYYESLQ